MYNRLELLADERPVGRSPQNIPSATSLGIGESGIVPRERQSASIYLRPVHARRPDIPRVADCVGIEGRGGPRLEEDYYRLPSDGVIDDPLLAKEREGVGGVLALGRTPRP